MSSRTSTIAKILDEAGVVARGAFKRIHKTSSVSKKPYKGKEPKEVRFIYKGNYYRRPLPSKSKQEPPELLKIPPAGPSVMPKPFKQVAGNSALESAAASAGSNSAKQTWSWRSWWKLNGPLLILNLGSVCTLVGFTRSDVLELRALSMTGSTTFVVYQLAQQPIRWPSIIWSSLFAAVNAVKITSILNERQAPVALTQWEEEIFHEHFSPHGVTPKQFEKLMSKGQRKEMKAGALLSRQGEQIDKVVLVVRGKTRANVLGRHLTAIGSAPGNREKNVGGDSGAWVGEMAFLQAMWDKDHAPEKMQKRISKPKNETSGENQDSIDAVVLKSGLPLSNVEGPYKYCAISTIVAAEDIEVIEWSFKDLEVVMKSSSDIQGSLTRAMTAAIVGKVLNFMVSRTSALPSWATWLDNWKNSGPRHSKVEELDEEEEEIEKASISRPVPKLAEV